MISKTAIGVDNYGAMIIKYNASAELWNILFLSILIF
jgi:hypothetical protein